MADDVTQQPPQPNSGDGIFDPVQAARSGPLDLSGYTDQQVFQHLNNPQKFRQAIPDYSHLSDSDISSGMQRTAARRPDYSPPPGMSTADAQGNVQPQGAGAKPQPVNMQQQASTPMERAATTGAEIGTSAGAEAINRIRGIGSKIKQQAGEAATHPLDYASDKLGDAYDYVRSEPHFSLPKGIYNTVKHDVVEPFTQTAPDTGQKSTPDIPERIGKAIGGTGVDAGIAYASGKALGALGEAGEGAEAGGALTREQAAREITNAVNPGEQHYWSYAQNAASELDKIKRFADVHSLPLDTREGFGNAVEGTKNAVRSHFYDKILKPVGDIVTAPTQQIPGYAGESDPFGHATLRQLDKRLGDVNAEMNSAYGRGGAPDTQATHAAVRSMPDLKAEADGIRSVYYNKLGEVSGLGNGTVGALRESVGRLGALADDTWRSLGKSLTGENATKNAPTSVTPTPTGAKSFFLDKGLNLARKGLGIANPADARLSKALGAYTAPRYELPAPRFNMPSQPNGSALQSLPVPQQPPASAALRNLPVSPSHVALNDVPNRFNPADALKSAGQPGAPNAAALYGAGNSTPRIIANALDRVGTSQPTGEELGGASRGAYGPADDLGRLGNTAGENQAAARFIKENPSALDRIPTPITRAIESKKPPVESTATSSRAQAANKAITDTAEETRLRARLKKLESEQK
jgi:hypothetical protein